MRTVAFFNNKGGVGKTTLVYHLAWMFQELGIDVVAIDLDPQANLTAAFLDDDRLERLWPVGSHPETIYGALKPLIEHLGDLLPPPQERIRGRLSLVPGDLFLGQFEDRLAEAWPRCLAGDADAFRVTTAFYRLAELAAAKRDAALVLLDVGPSLGPLNRAALVASDFVVMPLAADLFSLQGLRNLGPTLRGWRAGWHKRLGENPPPGLSLPGGTMAPAGYVILQHAVRADRPVKAYQRWAARIPGAYREEILGEQATTIEAEADPHCLANLKHYRSLMPLAQDARKPMFLLRAVDGALGGHAEAVSRCYEDFQALTRRILAVTGIAPQS